MRTGRWGGETRLVGIKNVNSVLDAGASAIPELSMRVLLAHKHMKHVFAIRASLFFQRVSAWGAAYPEQEQVPITATESGSRKPVR